MSDAAMSGIFNTIAGDHFERYLDWHISGENLRKEGKESHPHSVFLLAYEHCDEHGNDPYAILRKPALDLIRKEPDSQVTIKNVNDILKYIEDCGDGACVFNREYNQIAHVPVINPYPSCLPDDFDVESMIPDNFVHYNSKHYKKGDIGNKTRAAFSAVSAAHNNGFDDFYAIITKETAYGNDDVGMAALIGVNGLEEMYYLLIPEYEPRISETQVRHRVYSNNGVVVDKPVDNSLDRFGGAIDRRIRFIPQKNMANLCQPLFQTNMNF